MSNINLARRRWLSRALAGAGTLVLAGCDRLNDSVWFPKVLSGAEGLNRRVHKLLGGEHSLAQEFEPKDISPTFRGNGNTNPDTAEYQEHVRSGFAQWNLKINGLVDSPAALSLAQLKGMPSRTQITRHDCVEGWSAIGQWTGVPLATVLGQVQIKPQARYVVFHCADAFTDSNNAPVPYYESIDLEEAHHPQTILAYALNGAPLPVTNGAPLRLRVERQLGYKQAKYVMRLELVETLAGIGGGKGGYWEDQAGYQWYAGI